MSKNKGFSNTSAQRYSLALYELSNEANSIVDIEKHSLAILNLIEKNKDFNIEEINGRVSWREPYKTKFKNIISKYLLKMSSKERYIFLNKMSNIV